VIDAVLEQHIKRAGGYVLADRGQCGGAKDHTAALMFRAPEARASDGHRENLMPAACRYAAMRPPCGGAADLQPSPGVWASSCKTVTRQLSIEFSDFSRPTA
jgi:hypothetical protein